MTKEINIKIDVEDGQIVGLDENYESSLAIDMDENGDVVIYVSERHSSDNGIPIREWHGQDLSWGTPPIRGVMSLDNVKRLKTEIAGLLAIVHAGHEVEWDGSNMKGKLTEEAQAASQEIEMLLDRCDEIYDDTWFFQHPDEYYVDGVAEFINADMSDEDIAKIVISEEKAVKNHKIILTTHLEDYLLKARDYMQAEREERSGDEMEEMATT